MQSGAHRNSHRTEAPLGRATALDQGLASDSHPMGMKPLGGLCHDYLHCKYKETEAGRGYSQELAWAPKFARCKSPHSPCCHSESRACFLRLLSRVGLCLGATCSGHGTPEREGWVLATVRGKQTREVCWHWFLCFSNP